MRARIRGDGDTPMLYVFSSCHDFIRTVPALQHDRGRAEDIDTGSEDRGRRGQIWLHESSVDAEAD
jgi:hypothetical protein